MHRAQTHQPQQPVENAGVLQNGHPGVGADQKVHPHGDHDQRYQDFLGAAAGAGHDVGHGVAHQQADKGGDHCQLQRADEDQQVGVHLPGDLPLCHRGGGGEEAGDVVKGKVEVGIGKSVVGHKAQRHHDKQRRPHGVRGQDQLLQKPTLAGGVSLHSSISLSASLNSSSSLEKEE